jgi:hypothetical protein
MALSRRNPELGFWALARHFNDLLQMPHALDVTRIMPAEIVTFPLFDHEDHGIDPTGVFQRVEAVLLSTLYVLEDVAPFQRVAIRAYGPWNFRQFRPYYTPAGGQPIGIARHFGGFPESAGYGLGLL